MSTYIPTVNRYSNVSSVAAGFKQVIIQNVGDGDCTLIGTTLKAGESVKFEAPGSGTLTTIAYDSIGSEILVSTLTKV